MSKQWPYFLLAFLLPLLWTFWWWGAFNQPKLEITQRKGIHYAYLVSDGEYSKIEDRQKEVYDLLKHQGIEPGQFVTLIERDPRNTPSSQRRAQAGVEIAPAAHPIAPLMEGVLPDRQALVVSARAHPFIAYGKVYGALLDHLKTHGMSLHLPVLETTHDNTLTIEMTL